MLHRETPSYKCKIRHFFFRALKEILTKPFWLYDVMYKKARLPHRGPISAGHDAGAHEEGELEAQLFAITRVKDSPDFALPNVGRANAFLWEQQTSFCCGNPSNSPPSCLHSAFCPEKINEQCISRQILNRSSEWLQRFAATSTALGTKVFISSYTTSPLSLVFQSCSASTAMEGQRLQQITSVQPLKASVIFNLVRSI